MHAWLCVIAVDKPWSWWTFVGECEVGDQRVLQSPNGREETVLAAARRYGGFWTSICCVWEPETWLVRHVLFDLTPKTFQEATSIPQASSTIKVLDLFFVDICCIVKLLIIILGPTFYILRIIIILNVKLHWCRDDLEVYSAELEDLAKKILDLMAKALGVEANYMRELFDQGTQIFRMNYYPPCKQPELVIGLNPHSDPVGLTILLQVNEMEGLQVRKDGRWTPIKPLNNAFIVNVGDILEVRH